MRLGFIGNFNVPYTTECERECSFQQLDHKVIRFRENLTTADQLLHAMRNRRDSEGPIEGFLIKVGRYTCR